MSWGQGQPVLVLGSQTFDFKGDSGERIHFTKYQVIIDDTPPRDGAGYTVHEAKSEQVVSPGFHLATVSFSGGKSKTMQLVFQAVLGGLPELAPPNGAKK